MFIPAGTAVLFLFWYPLPPEIILIDSTIDFLLIDFIKCLPNPLDVKEMVLIPARAPASSLWSLIVVPPVPTRAAK